MAAPARRRRPDARPKEITEAALALFAERGFTATRLEDVAARAGLSKAAIYLYFEDKAALLRAVVEETAGSSIASVAHEIAGHAGPTAPLIRKLLLIVAGRIATTPLPQLIKLVISESRLHPEIGRLYLETVINKALPMAQALIERGIATGELRAVDARLAVKSLVGPMVLSAIWRSVFEPIGGEPLDVEALASQHADLILNGLLQQRSEVP